MRKDKRIEDRYTLREEDSRWLAYEYRRVKIDNTVNNRRSWTEEDKQYLRDNFVGKDSYKPIATHLKRTVISIEVMVYRLRLLTREPKKPYVPKLHPYMITNIARMKELISFIQYTSRVAPEKRYLIETAKQELRKLSGV